MVAADAGTYTTRTSEVSRAPFPERVTRHDP